ncbi:adp-ribosylation factor-related protein [Anaeramoeba flamelloides]|uniref:Adp-ribosylation factor-related protein n=1 Tax=Anaeramoeba flamelloides TaxID=1746091 RepID=A0ABQ8YPU8_9EUKA|nr:adp-ribosylation factor-related protein [Anaeramoeba flamelloides]
MFSLIRYQYRKFIQKPERNVYIFGLQSSGKTSILNEIRGLYGMHVPETVVPTIGQNFCGIKDRGYEVKLYDLGGQPKFRETWFLYLDIIDLVIYVVDGSDYDKFEESTVMFKKLMQHPSLVHTPVIVCVNKQDKSNCILESEFSKALKFFPYIHERTFAYLGTTAGGEGKHKGTEYLLAWIFDKFKNDEWLPKRLVFKSSGVLEKQLEESKKKKNEMKKMTKNNFQDESTNKERIHQYLKQNSIFRDVENDSFQSSEDWSQDENSDSDDNDENLLNYSSQNWDESNSELDI